LDAAAVYLSSSPVALYTSRIFEQVQNAIDFIIHGTQYCRHPLRWKIVSIRYPAPALFSTKMAVVSIIRTRNPERNASP
jgi:hypothetical protein